MRQLTLLLILVCLSLGAQAERIKDIAGVSGLRENQLIGYGLVVGLDGNGDQTTQTPFTVQSILNMMSNLGVNLPPETNLQLKNVAAVTVTASLPAFARVGETIDVTVSSIGNAKSLRGGTLVMTPLRGADGQVYAMAQGSVVVAGAGGQGGANQQSPLASGRVPSGATVEQVVPTALGDAISIYLDLHEPDFTTADRVVSAINTAYGQGTARALSNRTIQVAAPPDMGQRVGFLSKVENLHVQPGDTPAKVIMNARTGSVVLNQMVKVEPCAVSHGTLAVTINEEEAAAGGVDNTAPIQKQMLTTKADKGQLVAIPGSPSLNDVVKALNAVGATSQDLLAILQAMKAAGALRAELEII